MLLRLSTITSRMIFEFSENRAGEGIKSISRVENEGKEWYNHGKNTEKKDEIYGYHI